MKKIGLLLLASFVIVAAIAQKQEDTDSEHGFKRENVFWGGGVVLGIGSINTNLGINPEIGYSLNNILDVGVALNINYFSERADNTNTFNYNVRTRSFHFGGGPFARCYVSKTLFLQAQAEANSIKLNYKDFNNGFTSSGTAKSTSMLVGVGYMQRNVGQGGFYTVVLVDIAKSPTSPYTSSNGSLLPVIRVGYNFYLSPKKK